MSTFLQFNCLIHDKIAKKAIDNYIGILQEAFEQYQNLWENYLKLQEKYEQCNVRSSFRMMVDEPCTKTEDDLTPQRQLNNSSIAQEESVSLLELDTLNIASVNFKSNIGPDSLAHLKESPCKDTDDKSPSKSPVFSGKRQRIGGISVKKFAQLPTADLSICKNLAADMKTHSNSEKIPLECNQKLELSTSHHVETTFLSDGRRLKQSRLVFQPIKCTKKMTSLSVPKPASVVSKVEQESLEDISVAKASVTTESNVANTNETFEDVIEISPTQKNITFNKTTHRLRLKRKTLARQTKDPQNKYKCYEPVSNLPEITIDTVDFALCPSPKHVSIEVEDDKPLVENMTNTVINTPRNKVNVNSFSPVKMCSNAPIKKEDQLTVNIVQNSAEKKNNFTYEDDSFFLSTQLVLNKNDMDHFNLDDTENKPPIKKGLPIKNIITKICHCQRMNCRKERINVRGTGISTRDQIHQKDFGIQNFLRRQAHIGKIIREVLDP
ncbi:uncharacterized protein LOC114930564 isoform X2 [Nylanderia fulva]|uniref:uncharacterized protein LOC114930564 isoform X2 n=1 Tax=Nylanderia fulva TaxID=613905 RepID=UPI0010FB514E|nr:uncharacterized protein LOC114930564 isoform X2 [Nylanderia fulva]